MLISIILPVHNEKNRIRNTVSKIRQIMRGRSFEIIISEDGSTDGSDKIISQLAKKDKKVVNLHSDLRLGKGKALKIGFLKAKGDIICFMDMDLSTDIKYLPELIDETKKYDIVIGSRYIKGSITRRVFKRAILSQCYNILVRIVFNSKIHDHQCGFKAFRREVVLSLIKKCISDKWFIDTEFLVLAQRKKYSIKELPIKWTEDLKATKVRLIRDIIIFLIDIVDFRLRLWFE